MGAVDIRGEGIAGVIAYGQRRTETWTTCPQQSRGLRRLELQLQALRREAESWIKLSAEYDQVAAGAGGEGSYLPTMYFGAEKERGCSTQR